MPEIVIISDSSDHSLLLTADRLLIVLFKHSVALPIIYQVILYRITVVIRIQTQVKTITLYSHKLTVNLSGSNLHVYHSGHTLVLHTISVSYRPNPQSPG